MQVKSQGRPGSAWVLGYKVYGGFLSRVYGILQLKYRYSVYHFLWISGIKYTWKYTWVYLDRFWVFLGIWANFFRVYWYTTTAPPPADPEEFNILPAYSLAFSYGKVTPDERTRWGRHVGANRVHRRGGRAGRIQPKLDKLTTMNNQHMLIYCARSLMNINKV